MREEVGELLVDKTCREEQGELEGRRGGCTHHLLDRSNEMYRNFL